MPDDQNIEAEALERCDNMPFHMPGTIQTFGCLVGLDKKCDVTLYASENTYGFLGLTAGRILESSPDTYLPRALLHDIRNVASRMSAQSQRVLVGNIDRGGKKLSVAGHVQNDVFIIEITEPGAVPVSPSNGLDRLRWLTEKFQHGMTVDEIVQMAVSSLRAFSGFHRVLAYRFRPDGSGEIIAEDKEPFMEGFLGLRFPEYDIPPRVKALYQKTPIRMIYDVNEEQVRVIAKEGLPELDMSLAVLRGTEPQHTQYLRNMGVEATMTLPLVVDGKLWGLLAFHNKRPRYIGGGVDLAVEFAGQYVAMLIKSAMAADLDRLELQFARTVNSLFLHKQDRKSAKLAWNAHQASVLSAIPASGVVIASSDWSLKHGDCPPKASMPTLSAHLKDMDEGISFSDSLAIDLPDLELGEIAGALHVKVSDMSVYFFRKNSAATVSWAGAPQKELSEDTEGNVVLTPRSSFEAYNAFTQGRSDSWEPRDIEVAHGLRRAMQRAEKDLYDRDVLFENLTLVVQELNHRVRNILTLVQSIIKQSKGSHPEAQLQFDTLEARVLSLANAHNALLTNGSKSMDLKSALLTEANPYASDRVVLNGPTIGIAPRAASIFVLVLHELFSNAAKYGALSGEVGTVSVTWTLRSDGLHIRWVESGGPAVTKPERTGFGTMLTQNAFAYDFQGDSTLHFAEEGLQVSLYVPKDILVQSENPPAEFDQAHAIFDGPSVANLGLETFLIVEDDFLIGMQTKTELEQLGARKVLMANSNAEALRLIGTAEIDMALLDINLGGERSLVTAEALTDRKIPFIFVTGYDGAEETAAKFPEKSLLKKPFEINSLMQAIEATMNKTG